MAAPPPKITVYHLNNSRSIRITSLLEELSLPYTIIPSRRNAQGQAPPSLKKIHPLGKSPTIVIQHRPNAPKIVLHESSYILEYICTYWGPQFLPKQFENETERLPGQETEAWRRNKYFLAQPEGTLMPNVQIGLVFFVLSTATPFFIRPITNFLRSMVMKQLVTPEITLNLSFIESQLRGSGGEYLCGKDVSAADFMMAFSLETCMLEEIGGLLTREKFPACVAYLERLKGREAWKRAVERVAVAEKEERMEEVGS